MKSRVRMPGSCGELVQGTTGGIDFHITCPVDRYSCVTASLLGSGELKLPEKLDKTASAVKKALELIGSERGVGIDIRSELPQGKGMASSTADIAAAIAAVCGLFQRDITHDDIAKIALSIEPTDGTFFDGIVAFDHRQGLKFEPIGEAPPVEIIVLEPPEVVDTISFNSGQKAVNRIDEALVVEAFDMAVEGIRTKDIRLVGQAATISSILNQYTLPKVVLNDVINVCRQKGGIGVNVAHSGTVMGMMVEKGFGQRLFDKIAHYVPRSWNAYVVSMIDGGLRYDELESELKVGLVLGS